LIEYQHNTINFFLKRKFHRLTDNGLKSCIFVEINDLLTSGSYAYS
jgi:hypothetical protein